MNLRQAVINAFITGKYEKRIMQIADISLLEFATGLGYLIDLSTDRIIRHPVDKVVGFGITPATA